MAIKHIGRAAAIAAALFLFSFATVGCSAARGQRDTGALPDKENSVQCEEPAGPEEEEPLPNGDPAQDTMLTLPNGDPAQDTTLTLPNGDPEPDEVRYVIVLDPGHGGAFVGAANNGFVEKDLTLRLAGLVREELKDHPEVEVLLTRETDEELSSDLVRDLELRAEYAKEHGADALVSLHFNGSSAHDLNGAIVYVSCREHVTAESTALGKAILEQLKDLGLDSHGTRVRYSNDMVDEAGNKLDYYAINRHCAARDIPGIIVEHCYMDSSVDRRFFDTDEALKRLARADAEGILTYLGLK